MNLESYRGINGSRNQFGEEITNQSGHSKKQKSHHKRSKSQVHMTSLSKSINVMGGRQQSS